MRRTVFTLALLSMSALADSAQSPTHSHRPIATYSIQAGGANLQVDFEAGEFDLARQDFVSRIQKAALAVAAYYGRFPVPRARILIVPVAGEDGILQGTTWGGREGWPGFTRLRIGQHTTRAELERDWITTHELVHMALASLPDDQHWLEEGIATYVEPIARVKTGELKPERMWGDLVAGLPNGEPGANDKGMNRTHTWGRTYWGGALFCLLADVEIRKQTRNQKGLQDALSAIVRAGDTIDTDAPLERLLHIGDEATGTHVLKDMYMVWSEKPVPVNLAGLWSQLGVDQKQGHIYLNMVAPLTEIRVVLSAPQGYTNLPPVYPAVAAPSVVVRP